MKQKPYSHPRWWDNPMPRFSLCDTACKYRLDILKSEKRGEMPFVICEKRGEIPWEIFDKSFPGTEMFDENYCQYREEKTEED